MSRRSDRQARDDAKYWRNRARQARTDTEKRAFEAAAKIADRRAEKAQQQNDEGNEK